MSDAVRIDRITETKRGRYALFNEGEFLFSVDAETLAIHNICEGSSITGGELSSLREASDTRKAKDGALRFLSLRAYGEKELFDKLCVKHDEHSAAAAVATMRELGLLDDETFAMEKAKGMAERGKSSGEIRRKLHMLGIREDVVAAALMAAAPDDTETALHILHKSYMDKLRKGERQKVMAALARKGFGHADIRRAVEAALVELEAEEEQTVE